MRALRAAAAMAWAVAARAMPRPWALGMTDQPIS